MDNYSSRKVRKTHNWYITLSKADDAANRWVSRMSLSFSQMNSYSRQQNFVGKKQLGPIFLQRIAGYQLLSHDSQIICSLNSLHSINRECLQPDDPRDQCEQKLFHLLFHHLIRWPNNILEANKHQCSVGYCQIQTAR